MSVVKVKIVPWDDRAFVKAYEAAAEELARAGHSLHDPMTALELQGRLRAAGYPNATCYCERTVEEALDHTARCVVTREGEAAGLAG